MTPASTPRSESATTRWAHVWVLAAVLLAGTAEAHKSSDAYLQLDARGSTLVVRWDIALRDLDVAVDIDRNEDGKLTWGEVSAAWPGIEAYALAHLQIEGCALQRTGQALERRNDGAYAVLLLESNCILARDPVIRYTLLRDVDPTHRGIAKIDRTGEVTQVVMLDPTHPTTARAADSSAGVAATSLATTTPLARDWEFLREGVHHIVTGYDHILFLLCLLLPSVMRRTPQGWQAVNKLGQAFWPVTGIVTAFTLAHSLTLALAATGTVSLSSAVIEPAIAVTIIIAAIDNVRPMVPVPRIAAAFLFGLIHGFGFASVLTELNLPTAQFVRALLEFNIGIELGQLTIVIAATAVLYAVRKHSRYRLWVVRYGSFSAMAIAGLWLVERVANVSLITS
jgi:hypothetical protein